jgi:mono/diheme cytochrome c family protein
MITHMRRRRKSSWIVFGVVAALLCLMLTAGGGDVSSGATPAPTETMQPTTEPTADAASPSPPMPQASDTLLAPTESTAPSPEPDTNTVSPSPSAVEEVTDTPQSTATETPASTAEPDPARGAQLWQEKPCIGCHGAMAQGGIGPALADTSLDFEEVLLRVRTGKAPMPAFSEQEVSDMELRDIYAWLETLAMPTLTPEPTSPGPTATPQSTAAPLPPSAHLMAFWEDVNWVKVHSDFAKDAAPDIGALHDRVSQARDRANDALQEADQAIADIPNAAARATIREVKGFMQQILQHANAALATQDYGAAHAEAASMVSISRLDAWPRASLAVKQAGFTGSVLVRVTRQDGSAFRGALVTALTAPFPAAGQTDANGQLLLQDLAAVRVMPGWQSGGQHHFERPVDPGPDTKRLERQPQSFLGTGQCAGYLPHHRH